VYLRASIRVVLIFAIVAVVVAASCVQLESSDGLIDETLLLLLGEDTEYSAGYSSEKLLSLRVGDSEEHVREELGEPLQTIDSGAYRMLFYSRSPASTHYRLRAVELIGGRVSRVVSCAYID
jgi:hypothetical protein